jgi:transcriptional regulator
MTTQQQSDKPDPEDHGLANNEIARILRAKNSGVDLIQKTRENIERSRKIMAEADRILGKR